MAQQVKLEVQGLQRSALWRSMEYEQASTLCADSANIQTLLSHAEILLQAARTVHGKSISQFAEGETSDFERRLTDLVSDLESARDKIERHLDAREQPMAAE